MTRRGRADESRAAGGPVSFPAKEEVDSRFPFFVVAEVPTLRPLGKGAAEGCGASSGG